MGMGWGGATVSAPDVARFLHSLLGRGGDMVSSASVARMQQWHILTVGWDKGTKRYGIGLETNNPSPQVAHWRAPPLDHVATGIGHHGGTYVHARMHTHARTHAHARACTCTRAHAHTHTHTHRRAPSRALLCETHMHPSPPTIAHC